MPAKKSVSFASISKAEKVNKLKVERLPVLDENATKQIKVMKDASLLSVSEVVDGISRCFSSKAVFQSVIYLSLFLLILVAYSILWVLVLSLEKPILQWYDQPSTLPYLWYPSAELMEFKSTSFTADNSSDMPQLYLVIEKVKNSILLADQRISVIVDGTLFRNKPLTTDLHFQQLYNQTNTTHTLFIPCIQVSMYLHFGFYYWKSETQHVYIHIPQTGEVRLSFEPYNFFNLRDQYAVYTLDATATIGLCPRNNQPHDDQLQFVTNSDKKDRIWVREKLDFFYLRHSTPDDNKVPIVTTPQVLPACCQEEETNHIVNANIASAMRNEVSTIEMVSSSNTAGIDDSNIAARDQLTRPSIRSNDRRKGINHLEFPSCTFSLPSSAAHAIHMGRGIRFIQPEMMATIEPLLLPNTSQRYRLQVKLQIAAVYAHVPNGIRVVLRVNDIRFEFRRFFQLFSLSKEMQRQSLELWARIRNDFTLPIVQLEQLQLQHEATLTIDDLKAREINVLKVFILSQSLDTIDKTNQKEDIDCEWMHNDLIRRCKFEKDSRAAEEEEEELSEILDYDCRTVRVL